MTDARSPEHAGGSADAAHATHRTVGTGMVVALVGLTNTFAYASFLASGPNATLLPAILASALLSTAFMSAVLARYHSVPSALGGPAGNASAVVGAALSAVLAHESVASARPADTAIVLALTALLPGLAMLILARLRLARAIRFMPYPVIAGFFAGTGWLLVSGSVRMDNAPGPIAASVAFVALLRIAQQRWNSPLLIPSGVAGATIATYAGLFFTHISLETARAGHWLYPRMPSAGPVFLTPLAVAHANWGAITNAWSAFAWVVIVVVLVSLMNGAALEFERGADSDVDRDMAAVGAGNLLAGFCGGFGSQVVLPTSALALTYAPGSAVPAYVLCFVALGAIFGASTIVPFLPEPVFAGVIALLGLRLFEQYVLGGLRTMTRAESAAVIAMLLCTAIAGLQSALVLGSLIACITFTANAGQQRVVRNRLTLRHARSRVERSAAQQRLLEREGNSVELLRLQGHLFFGSANALYEALKTVVDAEPRPTAIVLDLAGVNAAIDVSATLAFQKVIRRARQREITIVFANIEPALERTLRTSGTIVASERAYRHLDDALEACEIRLLERAGSPAADQTDASLDDGWFASNSGLQPYFEQVELGAGDELFCDGEPADAMYVLVRGRLSVVRAGVHVRTLLPGALVGEVAFFTGHERSATVVADEAVLVERLSLVALRTMERDNSPLLAAFQRSVMRLQAARMRAANAELTLLHE